MRLRFCYTKLPNRTKVYIWQNSKMMQNMKKNNGFSNAACIFTLHLHVLSSSWLRLRLRVMLASLRFPTNSLRQWLTTSLTWRSFACFQPLLGLTYKQKYWLAATSALFILQNDIEEHMKEQHETALEKWCWHWHNFSTLTCLNLQLVEVGRFKAGSPLRCDLHLCNVCVYCPIMSDVHYLCMCCIHACKQNQQPALVRSSSLEIAVVALLAQCILKSFELWGSRSVETLTV